jgi:hypothetical protein
MLESRQTITNNVMDRKNMNIIFFFEMECVEGVFFFGGGSMLFN